MPGAVPDIPGELLLNQTSRTYLSQRVSELCGLPPHSTKFPGAQPVSMTVKSLEMLEKMDFWVCEKSDGVRVLVLIVMNGMSGSQEVWLVSLRSTCFQAVELRRGSCQIDRKQRYYNVENLHFPHWEDADTPLTDTILDGELVTDVDPATGIVSWLDAWVQCFIERWLTGRRVCVCTRSTAWCFTGRTSCKSHFNRVSA